MLRHKISTLLLCVLNIISCVAWAASLPAQAAPSARKSQIKGLIDRQNTAWVNQDDGTPQFTMGNVEKFPGVFDGIVINTSWNALQPSATAPLKFASIEQPLQLIRSYNQQHPTRPLAVKLRVWAGANAPLWAKKLAGGPVEIYRNPVGRCQGYHRCPISVGKFWDPAYIDAWRSLQQQLAAKYDNEPLIRQVAVTSCTQQTDEPFIASSDQTAKDHLRAAGYTDALARQCLIGAISPLTPNGGTYDYAPWKHTLIDFSISPFAKMAGGQDLNFSEQVMSTCRTTLGQQCTLDNESLGKQPDRPAIDRLYAYMQSLGTPINLQTASPRAMGATLGDPTQWVSTITQGSQMGAAGIEVWSEQQYAGLDGLTTQQVCHLASLLPSWPSQAPAICVGR